MSLATVEVPAGVEALSAQEVLGWALEQFRSDIALASGFGAEGMVLIDMASHLRGHFRVFTLDTDFLFPETYALIERVEQRYGLQVERCRPELSAPQQAEVYGEALWTRQPDVCCGIRKLEPLRAKLAQLKAWITAIRRDQTPARAGAGKVEWDDKFGLTKVNPLADWTSREVWEYIRLHGVPYNPLHDRNYPSIGCTHCTRPVTPGEASRAGRWSGFEKTECGLHSRRRSSVGVRESSVLAASRQE